MHFNHTILAGRKEGLESGSEGKRCLLFLYPVTLTTRGGHSVSTKNSAGLFQGPVIYRDVLILFPTFPASAVCCRTLLFYSLQRRQHLEAIAVAKKCFAEGREGRGGVGCRAGTAARVSHGKWINAAGRTGSCHWGRSREVSVFSGKWLCRVQFVSELSGSRGITRYQSAIVWIPSLRAHGVVMLDNLTRDREFLCENLLEGCFLCYVKRRKLLHTRVFPG